MWTGMIATLVLLGAAQPLHFTVSYQTAEVRTGAAVVARVLCAHATGVDITLMTDSQRQLRDDVLRRIDLSWAGEDKRGRARLGLALMKADDAAPNGHVYQNGCRFLFPNETVVRIDLLDSNPTGSTAVVVEDLESGQYLAVEKLGKPSDLPELFQRLFSHDGSSKEDTAAKEELMRYIKDECDHAAAKTRAVAEVNGQRDLLPSGATDEEIGAALARMWDNLNGEPRTRIERVLGLLAVVRAVMEHPADLDSAVIAADLPASAMRFKGVPAIEAPSGTRFVAASGQKYPVLGLQPPPEEIAKPFYGRRGWWTVDFSGSFPSQVERLLRGDRP